MNRLLSSLVSVFILGLCWATAWGADDAPDFSTLEESPDEAALALEGVIYTLDHFMMAGKEGDPRRGASLLEMYESSPRKAEREIGIFYEDRQDIFSNYVSISKDIYGYEFEENGYKGPTIELEGRVETETGFTAEFSARLVLRDQRWRILSLEID